MDKLGRIASAVVIVAGCIYIGDTIADWTDKRRAIRAAEEIAAAQLCLEKRAEEAKYRGGMDWTGVKAEYVSADKYCR